jgi:hypothetical protein
MLSSSESERLPPDIPTISRLAFDRPSLLRIAGNWGTDPFDNVADLPASSWETMARPARNCTG